MHRFVQFIKNDLMFLFNLKRVTYPSNNKRPFHPHFANVSNDNDISKMLICHCLLKHLKKEPCYDVPPSSSKYFEVQFWHKKNFPPTWPQTKRGSLLFLCTHSCKPITTWKKRENEPTFAIGNGLQILFLLFPHLVSFTTDWSHT